MAVKQGETTGLLGKTRAEAKILDVSAPHFYNTIKAAMSALKISELSQELQSKNDSLGELQSILQQKDKQIAILHQQLAIFQSEHHQFSEQRQEQLQKLQLELQQKEKAIEQEKHALIKIQKNLERDRLLLSTENIETKVKTKISQSTWSNLTRSTQKDLCDAYRQYLLVSSEVFTASLTDYSGAALGICLVAEREILSPFFQNFHLFLQQNHLNLQKEDRSYQIGGVIIKNKGKYTLGNLPPLLSVHWEHFRKDALEKADKPSEAYLYGTVFYGNKVSESDRLLVRKFLRQWQHPLSKWLIEGETTASTIDRIRQLRNRVSHHEGILYLWQFKRLWSLTIGSQTKKGILTTIY